MGGSGGKRARVKAREGETTTLGGKFLSTGSREEQDANRILVLRLMAEIGSDGAKLIVEPNDKLFLTDCRIKLNSGKDHVVFGWRQVAAMVRIHKHVQGKREETAHADGTPQK